MFKSPSEDAFILHLAKITRDDYMEYIFDVHEDIEQADYDEIESGKDKKKIQNLYGNRFKKQNATMYFWWLKAQKPRSRSVATQTVPGERKDGVTIKDHWIIVRGKYKKSPRLDPQYIKDHFY